MLGGARPRTVLGARRREACAWRDTPLGEIVRGDSAKLEEKARLVQNLCPVEVYRRTQPYSPLK